MSVFFYTFRTNKFVGDIERILGQEVYVIDRYAKGFDELIEAIEFSGAENVCGIGIIGKGMPRFEEYAFNKLGNNKISKSGPEKLALGVPNASSVGNGSGMTFGPCNYVAYRLAKTFNKKSNYFIHISPGSIEELRAVVW